MPVAFRKAGATTMVRRARPHFQQKMMGEWAQLKRPPEGVGTAGDLLHPSTHPCEASGTKTP